MMNQSAKPLFGTACARIRGVTQLERRMRPGAWSQDGFLGPTESLDAVLEQDRLTLRRLGIGRTQIAAALGRLVGPDAWPDPDSYIATIDDDDDMRRQWGCSWFLQSSGPDAIAISEFGRHALPDERDGLRVGDLHVYTLAYRGHQDCPWSHSLRCWRLDAGWRCWRAGWKWGDFDFMVVNRATGEWVKSGGLVVHLIREHQFFEGGGSPYRVDPEKLVRVLGLAAGRSR